jgi:hypothetical protein
MRKTTFISLGAIVLIIQPTTYIFGRFGLDNLSFDVMRKETIESILAVPHIIMNAGIDGSVNMISVANGLIGAFVDSKVLLWT